MAAPSRKKRLAFGLIATLIVLAAAELALRLHDFNFYFNFGADLLGMPLLELHSVRRVMNRTVEHDPYLFWRFKPNQDFTATTAYRKPVHINAQGFRGADFSPQKPAGLYRVACLGDSTTFGWSVGEAETFPVKLREVLAQTCPGKPLEVLNLGVTGYTSHQGRRLLERYVADWQPDLVVFAFGPNDRLPALKSDREHEADRTWDIGFFSAFLNRFQVYKLLRAGVVYLENRAAGLSLDPKTYIPRLKRKVSPEEFSDNVRAAKVVCDRIGADLILVNVDYPSLPPDSVDLELRKQAAAAGAQMPATWESWNAKAVFHSLATELAVQELDVRPLFAARLDRIRRGQVTPPSPPPAGPDGQVPTWTDYANQVGSEKLWTALMVDNGHPNPGGHELIAESLRDLIRRLPRFKKFCGPPVPPKIP